MTGIIVKALSGFYYVKAGNSVYECRARGKFRIDGITPLVGDYVEILPRKDLTGSIAKILPRTSEFKRPPVANINQLIIVVAAAAPQPNLVLVDKLLLTAEAQNIESVICINKIDLDWKKIAEKLEEIYKKGGYKVIKTSVVTGAGKDDVLECLKDKITAFAGASGVGKSSMLNCICGNISLKTGEISSKIERGRHTTRHVELIEIDENSYVLDTPGFSAMEIIDFKADELKLLFPEMRRFEGECRFRGCSHIAEPGCRVTEALKKGVIAQGRYDNYKSFYNELKLIKEWER